jgi:hypothetical protein
VDDFELLRRYEPVVRYTRGEHFFPMDVDRYVAECSLWEVRPERPAACVMPEGRLTLAGLIQPRPAPHGTVYYMRFVESLTAFEAARFLAEHRLHFKQSRGRLARVGLGSRLIDALFTITLILRGRVPGGTAAAAWDSYRRLQAADEKYVYYGRVVRQANFVCLQYWYFYCMNDWRSSFHGVNDHEADCEQVIIYLSEDLQPQWVAYASHDFTGDDLRRRWDDPELKREGDHPIIFAGAGSHASYFSPGEYMHEVELPFSGPLTRIVRMLQKFWRNTLRLGEVENEAEVKRQRASGVLVIPFVDYARGDGLKIGAGGDRAWEARLLPDTYDASPDHPQAWAHHYRGLWGLYARDPVAGENAPAGPKYNRDGSIRQSWFDPVGWAGLDKVTPPGGLLDSLHARCTAIRERQAAARRAIDDKTAQLRALGLEAESMMFAPHFQTKFLEHARQINVLTDELEKLRREIAEDHTLMEALDMYAARLGRGDRLPARSHLKAAHHPTTEETERLGQLAEAWAALSVGLLILGFITVLLFVPRLWLNGLVSLMAVISFLEALFRREARELIQRAVLVLALIALLVLVFELALPLLVLGIIALGIFIIVDNVRELAG